MYKRNLGYSATYDRHCRCGNCDYCLTSEDYLNDNKQDNIFSDFLKTYRYVNSSNYNNSNNSNEDDNNNCGN